MTDPKYDNPLPGPAGRKPAIGTVYVDSRTGETKQVVLGRRDTVLRPGATKKPKPVKAKKPSTVLDVLKENYAATSDRLAQAEAANASFTTLPIGVSAPATVNFEGQQYSPQEMQKQIDAISQENDAAKETLDVLLVPAQNLQNQRTEIKSKIDDAVENNKINRQLGVAPVLSETQISKLRKDLTVLDKKIVEAVNPTAKDVPSASPQVAATIASVLPVNRKFVTPEAAAQSIATPAIPQPAPTKPGAAPRTPTATTPTQTTGTGAPAPKSVSTPATKAVFDTEIVNERNTALKKNYTNVNDYLTDSGRFAKGSADYKRRAAYVKDQRTQFAGRVSTVGATEASSWLNSAKADYGWIASLYETDASIKKLLDDAVTFKYTPQRFLAEYNKTSWYNNTAPKLRQYQQEKNSPEWADKLTDSGNAIRQRATAKGIQLSDETISYLAEESRKWQWTEIELDNSIGAQYVAQVNAAETAATQNTGILTGQTDIRTSTQYQELKSITGSYLLDNVTEDELSQYTKDILVGTKTKETFKRDMAARAKLRYSSLGDYIDQGYDLKSVTQDYRMAAASTLEVDSGAVDFTSDTYAKAFNYVDPDSGKSRQMNLQEWNSYLRGLPEWQKTENAKEAYTKVALGLAQSFGRRM